MSLFLGDQLPHVRMLRAIPKYHVWRLAHGSTGPNSLAGPSLWARQRAHPPFHLCTRSFRTSAIRHDIFSVSLPIKSLLLDITRISLIFLPFWYRYRLFRRFKKSTRLLIALPVFALTTVIALGLDQSPVTARWRLLLMTERDELEWSQERFDQTMQPYKDKIVSQDDLRVKLVKRACDRLIQTFVAGQDLVVSCARWTRDLPQAREALHQALVPSARTETALLPFRPPTSNPEKVIDANVDWSLFVLDTPEVQAYVLPSRQICVTTGLLDLVGDREDFLAAILSHEIVHVSQRHATENLGFMSLISVAFDVLRGVSFAVLVSFPYLSDALGSMFNFMNNTLAERAFSRKLELEADTLGLKLMAQAGYDPSAALQLWEKLSKLEEDTRNHTNPLENLQLLRTHPCGAERLANIQRHLSTATKIYDTHKPVQSSLGPANRSA